MILPNKKIAHRNFCTGGEGFCCRGINMHPFCTDAPQQVRSTFNNALNANALITPIVALLRRLPYNIA